VILDHVEKEYALQVDCDTQTFGADVSKLMQAGE